MHVIDLSGKVIKLLHLSQEYSNPLVRDYIDWVKKFYSNQWDLVVNRNHLPDKFSINPLYYGKWNTYTQILADVGSDTFNTGNHLELGARGSFFGAYVSRATNHITISDNFFSWPMLGEIDLWNDIWSTMSEGQIQSKHIDCIDMNSFPNDHFDTIFTISVIEHLPDISRLRQSFKEALRCLKPGGLYIVDTDLIYGEEPIWFGYQNFFTVSFLNNMAQENGFVPCSTLQIRPEDLTSDYPSLKTHFCCGLLYYAKPLN